MGKAGNYGHIFNIPLCEVLDVEEVREMVARRIMARVILLPLFTGEILADGEKQFSTISKLIKKPALYLCRKDKYHDGGLEGRRGARGRG